MTSEEGQAWHKEPTRHELGVLIMEGETLVAVVPREVRADQIIADHAAARDREYVKSELRWFDEAKKLAGQVETREAEATKGMNLLAGEIADLRDNEKALAARVRELEAGFAAAKHTMTLAADMLATMGNGEGWMVNDVINLLSQGAAGKTVMPNPVDNPDTTL